MTNLKALQRMVNRSKESSDLNEQRVALCVDRMLAFREAISLEAALQEEPIPAALLHSGETAIEACLDIMSMFWASQGDE